jgi:hypothetical protein
MNATTRPKTAKTAVFVSAIDAEAVRRGVYWTLWRTGGVSPELAARWGVPARSNEVVPHDRLCQLACASPSALFAVLKKRGWKSKAAFNRSEDKIARVEMTRRGFRITAFETYEDAVRRHEMMKSI